MYKRQRDGFESIFGCEGNCKYAAEVTSTGEVVSKVGSDPSAIGYVSLDSVNDSITACKMCIRDRLGMRLKPDRATGTHGLPLRGSVIETAVPPDTVKIPAELFFAFEKVEEWEEQV